MHCLVTSGKLLSVIIMMVFYIFSVSHVFKTTTAGKEQSMIFMCEKSNLLGCIIVSLLFKNIYHGGFIMCAVMDDRSHVVIAFKVVSSISK